MGREVNSLGSAQYYGPRTYDSGFGVSITSFGRIKTLEYTYDYTNLPAASNTDSVVPTIPANSYILEGYHQVVDAFTVSSTGTVNFGLSQPDGSVIAADGLDATVDLEAQSAGDWTAFDGANIGATVGANDAQVTVTASGSESITAGKGVIVLTYIEDYSANL